MNPLKTKSAVAGVVVVFVTCITYLTAWSPPDPESDGENVNITNGGVNTTGPIQTKPLSPAGMPDNIIAPDAAAVVSGYGNDLVRTGSVLDKGNGLVVGNNNLMSSMGGTLPSGIVGFGNNLRGSSSFVVGNNNSISTDGTTALNSAKFMAVVGTANSVSKFSQNSLVSGSNNTVGLKYGFVAGQYNTVEGPTVGSATSVSAAIGAMNHIMSNNSWTMGSSNQVSSDLSTALGVGLVADSFGCTFVGDISAPVNGSLTTRRPQDPVFVVGNGTDANNRSNALIVKRNGDIIITKPQGDISMGDYQ